MSRGEMDVGGGGVDVVVAHQRLQHRQVHAGLGQRGAEGVPQRVRMTRRHPGLVPVIAEDRAQPGRRQRLAPMRALGHQEQRRRCRIRGARPTGRSGPARRRRDPAGPAVPCRPCRSPAPSRGRCRHPAPADRAPRPTATRRTASARRSPGPGRCGSCPAARWSRCGPGHEAAAAAPAPAAATAASGCPGAPAARSARQRPRGGPPAPRHRVGRRRSAHRPEANSPEIAASRRLIVVGAYPTLRPSRIEYTLPPGRPGSTAVRQNAKNRSSTSVVTPSTASSSPASHRANANRSNAYARTVRGE